MKKVIVLIRDWRWYRKDCKLNAICEWDTHNTDKLMQEYPNILLEASWEAVWLPKWYQWNSEVWHMTIWSGRIIFQSLARINKSIEDKSFFKIPELLEWIKLCKKNNKTLHLLWLLQTQWVHSHINHLYAILELCKKIDFKNVLIHIFTDWRDAPVTESKKHIKELKNKLNILWFWKIATISWRFFAMDRDNRRDRIEKVFNCVSEWIVEKNSNNDIPNVFSDPIEIINISHINWETDEFILPKKLKWYNWINENDTVVFWNFRTDRTRQLTKSLIEKDFFWFKRKYKKINFIAMTQYYIPMNGKVLFKDVEFKNILWEIVSKKWYRQLRISETEKYAHVTFFFNCQNEIPFDNEDRILINSPKVETYDLKPEMSVYEIKDKLIENIQKNKYELIITNFVNWDMVWHTWKYEAIQKAVKAVDIAIEDVIEVALKNDYVILIFWDHWNAEDQTEKRKTSHTTNPVPFIFVSNDKKLIELKKWWWLSDIAPTVLDIMWIEKPLEMTWNSLIKERLDKNNFDCKWKM